MVESSYRWRKTYGGMSVSAAQRLKELEKENARLKQLLADRMREVDALKQLLGKKHAHRGTTGGGARAGVLVELQRASLHSQDRWFL